MRGSLRVMVSGVATLALVSTASAQAAMALPESATAVDDSADPAVPEAAATVDGSGEATAASGYVRPAARADAVRVATYNICKSTCGTGRHAWAYRRAALVRKVRWANPDVLAIQEANTRKWRGIRHVDDVRRLLGSIGYTIANTSFTCPKGCTKGAHIFYRPDRMVPSRLPKLRTSAGMTSMARIAGVKFGPIQDRAVSWAFLTPRGSTRPTLYVSVHMVSQKTAFGEKLRVATASRIRAFTRGLVKASGLKGAVPVVVSGDFNSFARRQPKGAQRIMNALGFRDAFAAPVKANADVGTVNYSPTLNKYRGFPPAPYRYRKVTTRIDYVFSTVPALRHEVVVRLTGAGRFDERFRASDHNMVMVDLPVR